MRAIFICLYLVLMSTACTGGRNFDDDDDTTLREGEEVVLEEQEFFDAKPAISAAGDQVAFISGRDRNLRIYTYSVDAEEAARLTFDEDGLSDEFSVRMSPDGGFLAFIAAEDDSIDVYTKKFDGTGALQRVSDEANGVESDLILSDDGALLAFVRRPTSGGVAEVYVVQVDSEGVVADLAKVSGADAEESPAFIPTGVDGSYQLSTVRRQTTGFGRDILIRNITVGAEIEVGEPQTIEGARAFLADTRAVAILDKLIFISATDDEIGEENWRPRGPAANDARIAVQSIVTELAPSTSEFDRVGSTLGVSILSVDAATAGSGMLALVTRDVYLCEKGELSYVSLLKTVDLSNEDAVTIAPMYEGDEFNGRIDEVCPSQEEGEEKSVDTSFVSAVIARDATPDSYQIAYVTLFSRGDNEVRLLTYNGSDYEITAISGNPKPKD